MPISRAQSDFLKDGLHSREWQQAFWRPLPPALALTPVVPVVCSRFPLGHSRLLPICQKDTRLPSQSPSLQAPAFSHSSGSSSVIPKSSFSINQFYKVHLLLLLGSHLPTVILSSIPHVPSPLLGLFTASSIWLPSLRPSLCLKQALSVFLDVARPPVPGSLLCLSHSL